MVFPQCNRVLDKLKDVTSCVTFQVMILSFCSQFAIIDFDGNAARYFR